jgi:glycosyltransferase involved in cell wall biosynthesis
MAGQVLKSIDIVIPVFNEEEVFETLWKRLSDCFAPEPAANHGLSSVRYIFVDDGSKDRTAQLVSEKIAAGANATLVRLSRNFGHQSALTAGLDQSTADLVAVIDADLQDPPELILQMTKKLGEGFDVVYGERRRRKGNPIKTFLYWAYYRILRFLSDVEIPVDAGDFCVITREVLLAIRTLPEKLRFSRGLRSWVGFRQTAFPYDRPRRALGHTKYSLGKLYQLATDGIASMSIQPLRVIQGTLFLSLFATSLFVILALVQFFRQGHEDPMTFWFLAAYLLVGFTSSLQIACLYIMAAYIGRTYLEVKSRPSYVVMEIVSPKDQTKS